MKGALAAMMCAMLSLSKSARKPAGDVLFTAVIDEEYMSIGTSELIKRYRADAAIIGEPTNARVAVAHKGYVWLEIEMEGKAAHGSTPENGIDAIENMARIIRMLDTVRREYRRKRHPLLGTANIHTSSITGGTDWSTIPAKCRLGLERRLMPGDTAEGALRELKRVVRFASIEDRKINAKVRLIHHADSMQVERPPHLAILREQVLRAGGQPRPIGLPFWTDASILWNRGKVPTCIYGPGDIAVAHGQTEHVSVRELVTTARVYAETAAAYCA
jgi:acetylornithine deacetylase/succinyl-diaminopimelate desuccinylase-like protein